MFEQPFSFEGRIRRTEYGFSLIIYTVLATVINLIITESNGDAAILGLAFFPMLWFLWAQGAKRCHDVGNSGWWQLIPFYGFWLIFQDGEHSANQYGDNPKGVSGVSGQMNQGGQSYKNNQNNKVSSTYKGGYNGGHNNPNQSRTVINKSINNNEKPNEYKDGDLYN
ncbi:MULTISPECIES: DUF805 domain-containing protein [unclassified Polaribacter]|uniref:DUF805 domain-containing protein n=1 Tax=unclassified Polaribacter TaxID=196858 RepID=UPI0011BDA46D|nr:MULTISPECIES: DUF805 domain-containing protein [unclassified Polaribacter]TXD51682.1 DUF805 domain-containing protein [Polaribacter sp. IC063]TXD59567.1 DUF805 domain-containing protein [Polaribacter sp. IC066]